MLFKGTATRSAEDIAQAIDSIGGQLDAFTAKEYAELLHQGARRAPAARHRHPRPTSSCNPAFSADDIEREKKVVLEEIKMVEDTPDDLVHELFTQGFWENHPLGRPILGTTETVESFNAGLAARLLHATPTRAPNLIVSAVGNLEHERVRELVEETFGVAAADRPSRSARTPPRVVPKIADPQQGARAEPRLPRRRAAIRRTTTIAMRATC